MRRIHIPYILLTVVWLLVSCDQVKLSDARGHYLRGEYYAASEAYRKLYRSLPPKEQIQRGIIAFEMAENYRRLNQSARAVTAYSNAIRYGYPDTVAHLHYARMLHREGKYEAAAEAYRRFLAFRPDDLVALNGLRGTELAEKWSGNPTRYRVQRTALFNSSRGEFSPMLSPQGDWLYFTSSREDVPGEEKSPVTGMKYNDIFSAAKNAQGEWQKPERLGAAINTDHDEGTPSFSADGEWMFYTFCDTDPDRAATPRIYLSAWSNGKWNEGRPLEIMKDDSLSLFVHPAISPSGRYLYFVSDMPGGYGGKDIWRAQLGSNHQILSVENLGPEVNSVGDELFPCMRDEGVLYFASDGHPGMGGLDIFRAVVVGLGDSGTGRVGKWESGKVGEWESGRRGDRVRERWRVTNLQSPINSSADDFGITFVQGEEKGFFSSNRNDVRGYDHIYSFEYPEVTVRIEGFAVNQEDEFIPDAVVAVVGNDGSQFSLVTGKQGEYRFKAGAGVDYLLMASADGFLNQKQVLHTSAEEKDTLYYADFEMIPYHKPVVLENIFYDFDSATLRPESKEELDGLIQLLDDHPSVAIALAAHTDRKGSDEYNLDLSLRRAQSVVDYLVAHGIDPRRLSAHGLGKSQPVRVTRKMAEQFSFLKEGDLLTGEFIETLAPDRQVIADQVNRRTSFAVFDREFGLY